MPSVQGSHLVQSDHHGCSSPFCRPQGPAQHDRSGPWKMVSTWMLRSCRRYFRHFHRHRSRCGRCSYRRRRLARPRRHCLKLNPIQSPSTPLVLGLLLNSQPKLVLLVLQWQCDYWLKPVLQGCRGCKALGEYSYRWYVASLPGRCGCGYEIEMGSGPGCWTCGYWSCGCWWYTACLP